eukprot:4940104-Pyramimonas_sp.AAC.1
MHVGGDRGLREKVTGDAAHTAQADGRRETTPREVLGRLSKCATHTSLAIALQGAAALRTG